MKKCIFPVLMLCILLTACNSDKGTNDAKILETGANTTIAENTEEQIFTSDDGVVIIKPTPQEDVSDKETLNSEPTETQLNVSPNNSDGLLSKQSNNTKQAKKKFTIPTVTKTSFNGSLGHLTIDKIELSMDVFETDNTMEDMKKGAAHFKNTSVWEGNIGLSAHNDGVKESVSFGKLHTLKLGDIMVYKTSLGERSYEVTEIQTISDEDWSYLSRTKDNRITLITCVSGQPDKRFMVQAIEKAE